MNIDRTCVLCGLTSRDVSVSLISWIEPVGRDRYTSAPRCKDVYACRDRVEALGEQWDVRIPERTVREMIG